MRRILASAVIASFLAGLLHAQAPLKPQLPGPTLEVPAFPSSKDAFNVKPGLLKPNPGTLPDPAPKRPLTERETCQAWAAALQKAVMSGDGAWLYNALDWTSMALKIIPHNQPAMLSSPLLGNLHEALRQQGTVICTELAQGGDYRLLTLRRPGRNWKAVFRLLTSKGAFNYHEFELSLGRNGTVTAVDVYIAMTGETISDTMGRVVRFAALPASGNGKDMKKAMEVFRRQAQLVKEGRKEEASKALDDLPVSVKKEKWVMIARLAGSTGSDPKHYLSLVEEARKRFPHDASFDLMSLTYWTEHKEFDPALGALDKLKGYVGGDAFLDVYEAKLLALKGDLEQASLHVEGAIRKEPDLKAAYWTKIDIDLALLDFEGVARSLTTLESKLGQKLPDLTQLALFSAFVKSEAYETWRKTRTVS